MGGDIAHVPEELGEKSPIAQVWSITIYWELISAVTAGA